MDEATVAGRIVALARREVEGLLAEAAREPEKLDLTCLEQRAIEVGRAIARALLEAAACSRDGRVGGTVPGHKDKGDGKHTLAYVEMRDKTILTLVGPITYGRAYYHSTDPRDSRWPRDEELGLLPLEKRSPGVNEALAYASTVTGSYERATETLAKFLGIQIEYKQAQRQCLEIGRQLEAQEEAELKVAFDHMQTPGPIHRENAPEAIIVSVDGVTVSHCAGSSMEIKLGRVYRAGLQAPSPKRHRRRTRPRRGARRRSAAGDAKRKGELADLKESKEQREYRTASQVVGAALGEAAPGRDQKPMYRPATEKSTYRATARLGDDVLGRALWFAANLLGLSIAPLVLFLADGGRWCWTLCETHFGTAVQILDIFHLAKHVIQAANAFWGERSAKAQEWRHQVMVRLLKGEVSGVLAELATITFMTEAQRKAKKSLITYLTDNASRIDYPTYIAQEYPISSAMIEGACGHVIGDRMKGSRRRWDDDGADAMARLRAALCGAEWDALFKRQMEKRQEAFRQLRHAA